MSNQFIAEIRIFAGNFAPRGWAMCDGQLMAISQNTALFSLLGTYYGGDGKSNFALPNLQGRAPLQQGQGPGLSDYVLGEAGGEPTVTLLQTEIPQHTHTVQCANSDGTATTPAGGVWAIAATRRSTLNLYTTSGGATMSATAFNLAGGNLPHNNMMPYLALTFIIALQGVFPARS
jgi:microcystin-dependent protein